ncbi:MAG: hypothetical protein NC200_06635 [Candidatus Gastranaerophilales bacterium]|nr:hypothetical protein [Candidatus Gastranaerophilales bacterium]
MIGIQNQPQLNHSNSVKFMSNKPWEEKVNLDNDDYDSFDSSASENEENEEIDNEEQGDIKDKIKNERDAEKDKIDKTQKGWEEFANELESSDNKAVKKMGTGARFIASAVGLAGTFVVSKYSSKLTIETLKSFGKSNTMKGTMETIESAKKPLIDMWNGAKKLATDLAEKPAVKEKIEAFKNSKPGKAVSDFFANEKVKKVTEPIKNTIDSIKDTKINGEKLQSAAENTMAATATGSVLVDNLTGRNDNKSAIELATGS